MTIFTVHIPKGAREPDALAEEIRLVPESGSFAAFVFGPLWLAAKGAWRAAGGFALAIIALIAAQTALDLPQDAAAATLALIHLFIGLEGRQMERAALGRGRFELVDVVNAANGEEAEHIALRRLVLAANQRPARPAAPGFVNADLPGIGLFPGAGG